MFRIEFTSFWPLIVLAVFLAGFLVFWSVRNIQHSYYTKFIKYLLTILRIAAVLIFIILLTDMKIDINRHKQSPPEIAFLWDLSQSMAISDSTYHVKDILNSRGFKELGRRLDIRHIHSMQDPEIISESRLKQLPINEETSDVGALLRFAESQARFNALVLVSDGNAYLGENLTHIRLKKDLKVHAVGIGSKKRIEMPELRSLTYAEMIFEADSLHLNWYLYNPAEDSMDCKLILEKNGQEVYREAVHLPAERMIQMNKSFLEDEPGSHKWEFIIEKGKDKHVIHSEMINVHDSKIDIVYVSEPPDQDIAMMAAVLAEHDRYRVAGYDEWTHVYGEKEPDLVIQTWHPDIMPKIFKDVPAILVYRDDKSSYSKASDLRIVLQRPYVNFSPDHRDNDVYWTQLPPIQIARYPNIPKTVLEAGNNYPVIMEDREQRSVILNAAGMWRWNLAGYNKDWDGIYPRLIHGLVRTLLWQFENAYIALDEEEYSGLEYDVFPLVVQRFNEEEMAEAQATLRILDSAKIEIRRYEIKQAGEISQVSFDREGRYYAVADINLNGVLMESDTAGIRIEENDMETRFVGLDENALRSLTEHHQGGYIRLADIAKLPDMISSEKKWVSVSTTFIARNYYLFYGFMFLLLVADWVIRKRNGGI